MGIFTYLHNNVGGSCTDTQVTDKGGQRRVQDRVQVPVVSPQGQAPHCEQTLLICYFHLVLRQTYLSMLGDEFTDSSAGNVCS